MVAILNEKSNKCSLEYFWYLSTYKQRAVIGAGGLCSKFCSKQPYNLGSIRLGTLSPHPRPHANAMVRLQQSAGAGAKATTGFSLLPLPVCLLWGRSPLGNLSHNVTKPEEHQEPPKATQTSYVSKVSHPKQVEKALPLHHSCWT